MDGYSKAAVRRFLGVLGPLLLAAAQALAADGAAAERLSFDVNEGLNLNSFLRDGPVAAHLLLRSGHEPRILVAFPAGNSGVGLWFARTGSVVSWTLQGRPQPTRAADSKGRPLYGMVAEARVSGAELDVKQAVLSSVRVLRDYQALGTAPESVGAAPIYTERSVTWARDRLDGAPGYLLALEVTDGTLKAGHIGAGADGTIAVRITAASGDAPLTPLSGEDLLEPGAGAGAGSQTAKNALSFLSYQEKFLAGSWRFNTYFGRDTLMSVRLLMPALTPKAIEAGLGAVLTRVAVTGEVAHEEDIGEFAILDHVHAGQGNSDAPVFNYNMIDGNYMLAPVLGTWLLDDPRGRRDARAFLARVDGRYGEAPQAFGVDLVGNLRLVLRTAQGFAAHPDVTHLIGLKPGFSAGQWRDSSEGLGRGRYPFDVNAVLVPAALTAASRLYAAGLLDPYLRPEERASFTRASALAQVWNSKARALFAVTITRPVADRAIDAYAGALGVSAAAAHAAIGNGGVRFSALALDSAGQAVPILHSDEGFELLFGHPSAPMLEQALLAIMRPFPAGLLTDAGMVVANPVFASPEVQARFSKNAYHGTVVWSWQQAVMAAGLERQLRREDLQAGVHLKLLGAQRELWRAIDAGTGVRDSELWSWSYEAGHYRVAPFGASQGDVDESNAAQLWSTVYLAIPEPGGPAH